MISATHLFLFYAQAGPLIQNFYKARVAAARMALVWNRATNSPLDSSNTKLEKVRGKLNVQEVTFCYPSRPDVEVLSGFSLLVAAGRQVALVGGSGCGKSTLVALVERFYDPQQGTICLDGVDIRTLNLRWLRQQVRKTGGGRGGRGGSLTSYKSLEPD